MFGADDQLGDHAVTSLLDTRKVLLLGLPGIVALHQFPRRGGVVRLQFDVSGDRLVPRERTQAVVVTAAETDVARPTVGTRELRLRSRIR